MEVLLLCRFEMQRIAAFEAFEVLKQMKMKETSSNSGMRNLSQLCF